ncbi:MAG: TPM domain-containing protein [Acidobacteriota bacterium]|nr:TPM domain-containing protein [Acidobacteriota bacterium]
MRRFGWIALLIALAAACVHAAIEIPRLSGRVNDGAGILNAEQETTLEGMLQSLEDANTTQVVLLTVNDLQGVPIEDFSIRVAEAWKIGQQGLDNGVIVVVALQERRIRIEVGYGLEPILTDAKCDYIIRRLMIPAFKQGDYYQGIQQGLARISGVITSEFDISPEELARFRREEQKKSEKSPIPIGLIILIIIIVLSNLGGRGGGGLPFIFFGGGGGGGFSGGGGGFSGGGGSFGGGGASGGW